MYICIINFKDNLKGLALTTFNNNKKNKIV